MDDEISGRDSEEELDALTMATGISLAEDVRDGDARGNDIDQDDLHHNPTPWAPRDKKQTIIGELKDETSGNHLLIENHTTNKIDNVNFAQI